MRSKSSLRTPSVDSPVGFSMTVSHRLFCAGRDVVEVLTKCWTQNLWRGEVRFLAWEMKQLDDDGLGKSPISGLLVKPVASVRDIVERVTIAANLIDIWLNRAKIAAALEAGGRSERPDLDPIVLLIEAKLRLKRCQWCRSKSRGQGSLVGLIGHLDREVGVERWLGAALCRRLASDRCHVLVAVKRVTRRACSGRKPSSAPTPSKISDHVRCWSRSSDSSRWGCRCRGACLSSF